MKPQQNPDRFRNEADKAQAELEADLEAQAEAIAPEQFQIPGTWLDQLFEVTDLALCLRSCLNWRLENECNPVPETTLALELVLRLKAFTEEVERMGNRLKYGKRR